MVLFMNVRIGGKKLILCSTREASLSRVSDKAAAVGKKLPESNSHLINEIQIDEFDLIHCT